jgi:hypothetical protein
MNRSFAWITALIMAGLTFLSACSMGPATKQEVCAEFDDLGRKVAGANGIVDNAVFNSADDLADLAERYSGTENLGTDAAQLSAIADSTSTNGLQLMNATEHIADLCGHPMGMNALFDLGTRQNAGAGPAGTPDQRPQTPEYTPPGRTTSQSPTPQPAEFRRANGPAGLSVDLPAAFQVTSSPAAANLQAADPADPDAFVRFGGSAAPKSTLLAEIEAGERTNPNIRAGYRRIQLTTVPFQATTAVDWEFTFDKGGVSRHAYGRYWRSGTTGYVLYASAPAGRWNSIEPVFGHLLSSATTTR